MRKKDRKRPKSIYEFIIFGYCFTLFKACESESVVVSDLYYSLFSYFEEVTNQLIRTKEDIKKLFDSLNGNSLDLSYAYNPAVQFPFIDYNGKIFSPLPHIVMRAVTNSMYYRLTEDDKTLREKLGKAVLESYLLEEMRDCEIYDECFGEKNYVVKRNHIKSPDVLARCDDSIIMIDSKSLVASIGFKQGHSEEIEKFSDKIAKAVEHIYERAHEFNIYNPFDRTIYIDKIWCCVAYLEESFVYRESVYSKASVRLNIKENSEEYNFLILEIS